MPVVGVTLVEGRSRAEKEAMPVAVTEAPCRTVACTDYAIAGVSMATLRAEAAAKG